MDRDYFTNCCGRTPYDEIWLERSGAASCVATLSRMRAPVGSHRSCSARIAIE